MRLEIVPNGQDNMDRDEKEQNVHFLLFYVSLLSLDGWPFKPVVY